jgi:preprotein translocase subunit SecD
MKIHWCRFNIYLAMALAVAAVCGCRTSPESRAKKQLSTLRLHLETSRGASTVSQLVPIYREQPLMVNVETMPFLNESNISEAKVVDVVGGFALRLQFDHAGATLLEQYTTANRGRKIAVFSQFGDKLNTFRWLAAPLISRRISDGVFIFTPDANREEAEEIARGLNNVAKKTRTWIDK